MGTNSGVNWTDHSWSPWKGCTKCATGCLHCYAEREMTRFGQNFSCVQRTAISTWNQPLARHRNGSHVWKSGSRVFVCPWSDFFHFQASEWRSVAWDAIRLRPDLRWIILTKRAKEMAKRLPENWGDGWAQVCLGVSCSTQDDLKRFVPDLFATPAACHIVSLEPLLDPVWPASIPLVPGYGPGWANPMQDIHPRFRQPGKNWRGIDGIIIGCESGPRRRPMRHEWARNMIAEAENFAVPVYLKQICEHADGRGKVLHDPAEIRDVFGSCPRELPPFFDLTKRGETP